MVGEVEMQDRAPKRAGYDAQIAGNSLCDAAIVVVLPVGVASGATDKMGLVGGAVRAEAVCDVRGDGQC